MSEFFASAMSTSSLVAGHAITIRITIGTTVQIASIIVLWLQVAATTPFDLRKRTIATIGLVRLRAREWHIDPHKIGVLGFSAGGSRGGNQHEISTTPVRRQSTMPTKKAPARILRCSSIRDISRRARQIARHP